MSSAWAIAFIVQWLLVLALILLVAGILRKLAFLQQGLSLGVPAVSAYQIGQRIDDFELSDATGTPWRSSDVLNRREGAVLLFVTSSCPACLALLGQVGELVGREDLASKKTLIVIGAGAGSPAEQLMEAEPALRNSKAVILSDTEATAMRQFAITSVPTGLVVDRLGRVTDQNLNPHIGAWLYDVLDATPPTKQATTGTWVPVISDVVPRRLGN